MTPNKIRLLFALLYFTTVTAWGLSSDAKQPYYITANKAIYDRNQHITTYLGNVQVIQGSSLLFGDKAILYQDDKNFVTHVVAYGSFAHYSTLPEPGKDRMHAYARSIDYNPNERIVWLIGDGHVSEGGEFFSGPHIWYNMNNGLVRTTPTLVEGTSNKPTPNTPTLGQRTVIILPGNKDRHILSQTTTAYSPTPPTAEATIEQQKKKDTTTFDELTSPDTSNPETTNNSMITQ